MWHITIKTGQERKGGRKDFLHWDIICMPINIKHYSNLSDRFIIEGDFNPKYTHWGWRLITPKSSELYKAAADYGYEFVSNKTPDLIDFFVVKNTSSNYIKIEEGFYLNKDHPPICLTISCYIMTKHYKLVLITEQTDWEYINYFIITSVPLKITDHLEEYFKVFMIAIQKATWKNTPMIKTKLRSLTFLREI